LTIRFQTGTCRSTPHWASAKNVMRHSSLVDSKEFVTEKIGQRRSANVNLVQARMATIKM